MTLPEVVSGLVRDLVIGSSGECVVNAKLLLQDAILRDGRPAVRAAELAEVWLSRFCDELESQLAEWDRLGLPRPLLEGGVPATFLTFRHPRYCSETGKAALPEHYGDFLQLVQALRPRELVLVGACLLQMANCDPIVVTDGPDDRGVDLIGRIATGFTRSLCLFVQARTASADIDKNSLITEFGKYQDLLPTARYSEYIGAVGGQDTADGCASCFIMIANTEFARPAREYARGKLLLRSARQLAYWLGTGFTLDSVRCLLAKFAPTVGRDLRRNLAPEITPYRRGNSSRFPSGS